MNSPWPPPGPANFDDLAAQSDAPTAEIDPDRIPALSARPPSGAFELVDGRGVFVRRTDCAGAEAPDAWYVHGLAGSSTNWIALASVLSDRSRGFLVDLPGHGRSDPPPRGRYSLVDDADLLAELIQRRSAGPVHLVGNSMGGMVCTALAARHPELLSTLTLISPAVPDLRLGTDRGADPRLALLMLPGTAGLANRRLAVLSPMQRARGMGELCFGDPSLITEEDYRAAAADLAWRFGLPWLHSATVGSLRALMTSYLQTRAGSFRRVAAGVTVPTLVIWGTRDRLVDPRLAARTAAAFPDASLLVLAGVGHTAQMEAPAATAQAVAGLWARSGAPHRTITAAVAASES